MADLSDTAVVLPDQLTSQDIEAYLALMGMMGDSTGFPGCAEHRSPRRNGVDQMSDMDLTSCSARSGASR